KWFDHQALFFQDRHGLNLALVEGDEVAEEAAILVFHGAELLSSNPEGSKDLLTAFMGLDLLAETESAYHLATIGVLGHEIIIP
ncbi:ring-cleaving dioxygenase, partial [Streptococcus pyogenes]